MSSKDISLQVNADSPVRSVVARSVHSLSSAGGHATPSVHSSWVDSCGPSLFCGSVEPPCPSAPASAFVAHPQSKSPSPSVHASASLVTPSVQSKVSHSAPATPSVHSLVLPGAHVGVPRKRLRTKSFCTEAFTSCTCQHSSAKDTNAATVAKGSKKHTEGISDRSFADKALTQDFDDDAQYRPDVAPYPRNHPAKRKLHKTSLKLPQSEQVWYCPLCHYEIRIEPVLRARYRLRKAKSNHTMTKHSQAERLQMTRLGNVTEIFEPTQDIPLHEQAWTCYMCQKGLPSLPRAWSEASIRKHFEVAHPDETPTQAYRQKQCEDPALRERMKKRGEWVGLVKQKRQQESLHSWGPATGHDLSYLCFRDPPPEGFPRNQRSLMWLTCAQCRKNGLPSTFKTIPCTDNQRPIHFNSRARLRTLAQVSQDNFDAVVTAFKLSSAEAQEILGCRPANTEVPGQDPTAGVRIGEAQHPGPRRRIQHQDKLKVWTFNCGGAKQAWALWDHIDGNAPPKVILLQETAFKKHEWVSYQKVALKNGYHAFFSGSHEIRGTRQASGGATVLVQANLPVRPAWHCATEGGAARAVWVAGKLMVSVYLAPCFASTTIYQDVSAKILGLPQEQDWLIGGDFNATPQ